MSEEEKQAIEYWQYIRDTQIYDGYKGHVYSVVLLNLINKQQKEIEQLNEIKQQICNEELITKYYVKENFISKDKIRKKFLEAKGLYERGVHPQAQYTMKLLQELLEEN